jgi:phosphate:Na+ symporter
MVAHRRTTIALVELVGYVILLLWGMHMVQSGVVRAFGSDLTRDRLKLR